MIETLWIPFEYDYMLKAMWVSALIGGVCGLLSCFVTLKGWSLMGDALSHAVVPGVSIAYLLGAPYALGAFISGLLAAVGMGFIKTRTSLREDAVIGVVFTTFFALGV
jgi:manganese/iron transport system permease protein